MLVRKAFRYRIYPTVVQAARLDAWSDALRFLWNLANEQRVLAYVGVKCERKYPTAFDQMNELTDLRKELPWLRDVPRNVSGQLLVELDRAWQRCFAKLAEAPRWKRRGRDAVGLCEPHPKVWSLDGNVLRFPKVGSAIRAVVHRPLQGTPKTCTITRDGDQWFASIVCAIEVANCAPRMAPVIAIDRGIIVLAATSDGEFIVNPRHFEASHAKLAHAQRSVSRKQKGSRNQAKARLRVARIHRKIRRQRAHYLHVQSTRLAKSHGIVVIEKLNVAGMVRANSGLARSIQDASWTIFANQLRYKLEWSGGSLVEVPAQYSSQTCSSCWCVDKKSRRSQSLFVCVACGHSGNADVNAAKVLLARANRPGMPVEGELLEGARRSRKVKVELRKVRRSPLQNSGLSASG